MKKMTLFVAVAFLMLPSMAFAMDITINDQMASSTWSPTDTRSAENISVNEDSEVEYRCSTGQKWDLEAVILTPQYVYDPVSQLFKTSGYNLTLVGGWDFLGAIDTWTSGDLFLAFGTKPLYGNADIPAIGGNGNNDVANTFGYDYAFDMNWGTTTSFAVVDLNQNAPVLTKTAYYNQNEGADPWKLASGGEIVGRGFASLETYADNASLWADYAELNNTVFGGKHYAATFDISDLLMPMLKALPEDGKLSMWTHFTQQCGNDDLMGGVELTKPQNIVPEPSSMALLLLGLLGTFARKLRA